MNPTSRRRDPIRALEHQDDRQRKDLLRAVRFVAAGIKGDELRRFVAEATTLLRRFAPRGNEPAPGGVR